MRAAASCTLARRLADMAELVRPRDRRRWKSGPREQVALAIAGAGRDHRIELLGGLDPFRDDLSVELAAQPHDTGDQLEQARVARKARDQTAIELDDARVEV